MLLLCVHSAVTHPNSHGQEEEGDRCFDVGTVGEDQLQASEKTGCLLHIVLHCQKTERQKASGHQNEKQQQQHKLVPLSYRPSLPEDRETIPASDQKKIPGRYLDIITGFGNVLTFK